MLAKRVAVLRGGPSEEYGVSMTTGAGVLDALKDTDFYTKDVVISKSGDWMVEGYKRLPADVLQSVDVVFVALHGAYGEDGTVQRLLDRFAVPYTGSQAHPSAMAMNKLLTKAELKGKGIKMAEHMRVTKESGDLQRVAYSISTMFGPDYFIKPINGGSSIDVLLASGVTELSMKLTEIMKTRDEALVERRIVGREATVGVLENFRSKDMYTLPVVEIVPPVESDFFDYQNKYDGTTKEICPGQFNREEKDLLENAAATVHKTLGLRQYSRSDFIVAKDGVYFLEVNTLPGLTEESLFPKAIDAVGCSYKDFITYLLTDALERC